MKLKIILIAVALFDRIINTIPINMKILLKNAKKSRAFAWINFRELLIFGLFAWTNFRESIF